MYRLAGARGAYPGATSVYAGAVGLARGLARTERASCTLCRRPLQEPNLVDKVGARQQSTRTASILQKLTKKKIKYKKQKKYVELIEVNDKTMSETKASVNNLRAVHLSKLASSPVSLGQLHQLTTTAKKKEPPPSSEEIDFDLLKSIENEIMNKYESNVPLEDDSCALIFTSQRITNENKLRSKEYLEMVKDSYNSFRRSTIRDQRLKDLSFAINEGLNQEFELDAVLFERAKPDTTESADDVRLGAASGRGAHNMFRELLAEHRQTFHVDNLDPDLLHRFTALESRGIPVPAMEEMYEESCLEADAEGREELDLLGAAELPLPAPNVKPLNVKKSKAKSLAERKAVNRKRQQAKERPMKHDAADLERRGKQESLDNMLAAHLHLHCSLGLVDQGRQILLHYRSRGKRNSEQPQVRDHRIYNMLLQGYADKGDYNRLCELLSYMREDDIQPDIQTYAAVFQCIERSQLHDKISLLRQYEEEITNKGWSLNDLLDKCEFVSEQRACTLTAARRLRPGFQPCYSPPDVDYVCPLLERLRLENLSHERKPSERKKLEEVECEWREVLREAFVRNLSTLKSQSNASHSAVTLYPYLTVLESEQFVELMMEEVRRLADGSETYSPTLRLLQHEMGLQVYSRYQVDRYRRNGVLDKIRSIYGKYCEWYAGGGELDPRLNSRQVWQTLLHENRDGASLEFREPAWPGSVCLSIGKFLYNILINDVKININMFKTKSSKAKKLPAIYKVHRSCGRLCRVEVKPHPLLSRLCRGAATPELRMRAALAPLACPPAPWSSARRNAHGAYLLTSPPLVRMPANVVSQWKLLEAAPPATLYPALDSLNQLGEVPWCVNTRILDLQLQVFRAGGSKELDISRPPSALDTSEFGAAETKAGVFRRRLAISRARAEMYSLWCDTLYKLSLANHYREEVFWLPHNMDFRGRVYACPPHLSQLGADAARALLRFARAEPLGAGGLRWLKLHLVNLTGTMKKKTLQERLQYADTIMDQILDSADRPLDGRRWWAKSEEPWQTLACCMEIANAVRSPDPEAYECSFPVHQDGSCNGLQHYAALGGDAAGAASVNLAPLASPQDVYSAVATSVESARVRDAAAGVQAAQVLEGFVRRKVIKQTVMTTVYGVTRFGARLQIAKQLKDIDNFPKDHIWACSSYLTSKTFDALREMFTSTKLIQDWFTDCARAISGVCGESVEWVTPLGLPVVQPYHRRRKPPPGDRSNAGSLQEHTPLDHYQRPCTVKQKNAFPPNFIHSLDSSHMMLTSLHCRAAGVHFVSVHDCFWTHASTVDQMNVICREQFVALHSQPILEDLSLYLMQRYSYPDRESSEEDESVLAASKRRVNKLLQAVPEKGNFRLDNVLSSVYFFS